MSLLTIVTLLLAAFAVAVPVPGSDVDPNDECPPEPSPKCEFKTCSTSNAKLVLPEGQTALTPPTGDPSFVLLGVGFQNYTCSASGNYTSIGATADLFDLSCLSESNPKAFEGIQDLAFAGWMATPLKDMKKLTKLVPEKLGEHFFINKVGGGIAPVWDFRGDSAPDKPDAFVVASKVASIKAPTGSQDVDWLQLKGVSGGLAASIYRTDTRGGQPPASCTPGSGEIQVKYVSKYWLYGGNVTLS